jgi:hypothetical protein
VFNRVLPSEWSDAELGIPNGSLPVADRTALRDNLRDWSAEARRQDDAQVEFAALHLTTPARVPWLDSPPTSLDALANLSSEADGLHAAAFGD